MWTPVCRMKNSPCPWSSSVMEETCCPQSSVLKDGNQQPVSGISQSEGREATPVLKERCWIFRSTQFVLGGKLDISILLGPAERERQTVIQLS